MKRLSTALLLMFSLLFTSTAFGQLVEGFVNKSGVVLDPGNVVILDTANTDAMTTTTSATNGNQVLGVVTGLSVGTDKVGQVVRFGRAWKRDGGVICDNAVAIGDALRLSTTNAGKATSQGAYSANRDKYTFAIATTADNTSPYVVSAIIVREGTVADGGDADTVDGIHASATATANYLLALDANKDFDIGTGDFSGTDQTLTGYLRIKDASGVDEFNIRHDGSNLVMADAGGTGAVLMQEHFYIQGGKYFRIYDATNADILSLYHDGGNGIYTINAGSYHWFTSSTGSDLYIALNAPSGANNFGYQYRLNGSTYFNTFANSGGYWYLRDNTPSGTANDIYTSGDGYLVVEGGLYVDDLDDTGKSLHVNTDNSASPAWFTRWGSTAEGLKLYTDDTNVMFQSVQDENSSTYGGFNFQLDSGGTANPKFTIEKDDGTDAFYVEADGDTHIVGDLTVDGSMPSNGSRIMYGPFLDDPTLNNATKVWLNPSSPLGATATSNGFTAIRAADVTGLSCTFDITSVPNADGAVIFEVWIAGVSTSFQASHTILLGPATGISVYNTQASGLDSVSAGDKISIKVWETDTAAVTIDDCMCFVELTE